MELKGGVTIVTGASRGLGAAAATQLAAKGCNVVINYRASDAEARATAAACEAHGVEALVCQANVAEDADCRRLAQAAVDRWGRIDALVNNAGTTVFRNMADLEGLTAEDFQQVYAVNVIGPFQMVRAVVPHMQAAGHGAIVNVSSVAAVMGIGSSLAYAASKGALNTLTLSLARVLGPAIRVNAVCPGFIQGRWLREGLGADRYDATKAHIERTTPLQKAGTPEEIAEAVVWLLEAGKLVTGETLLVDAGLHLGYAPLVAR